MSDTPFLPLVSVIIPTLRRPELVCRAIRSVLAQTYERIEIIVVLDGPDQETLGLVRLFDDKRLTILQNATNLGAARSRNAGAAAGTGDYVAFLDDDDEWWPTKIDRQLACLAERPDDLATCLTLVSAGDGASVRPAQPYDGSVALDVWLFGGHSLFAGPSFLQTSSLVLRRSIFEKCPFPVGSPHDDWEFAIRLTRQMGLSVVTVPDVLVTVHAAATATQLSSADHWRKSLEWAARMRPLMSPGSVSGFCLGVVGSRAAAGGQISAMPVILYHALRWGRPSLPKLLAFCGFCLIPGPVRQRLRAMVSRPAKVSDTGLTKTARA